ncbi:hypothetical protein PIB30_068413 [Stylosanthes scabra]|uniref:Secreted protein n=1 Tax=Stylosanthes scabra TaxID=79078 RepID=A0ABU6RP11_9FABA|nr:hypothetical protein [Stylosanthes scabra]
MCIQGNMVVLHIKLISLFLHHSHFSLLSLSLSIVPWNPIVADAFTLSDPELIADHTKNATTADRERSFLRFFIRIVVPRRSSLNFSL